MAVFRVMRVSEHGQIPTEKSLLFLPIRGESAEHEGFVLGLAFEDYAFAFLFGLCAATRLGVDEYMWLN